jgi:hypothetical protein
MARWFPAGDLLEFLEVSQVRLSFIVNLLAVPCLAILLSGCSKEGEAINPKIKEKPPDVKQLPPPVNPGEKGNKGAPGPVPD